MQGTNVHAKNRFVFGEQGSVAYDLYKGALIGFNHF